ncbi:MAG: thiamine phosphate synthase [Alphaproteobacteria bacterium]|nr:thiamine phosphate synthase [Alphaproteobacteria bacterium]MBT7943564.1 thiamine phosphate synthase [Alphaproteobacteria bacterium]
MSLSDLESRLNLTAPVGHRGGRTLPGLILMTDETRLADPLPTVRALPDGSAVILRHYGDPDRAGLAAQLVAATRGQSIRVLVAGDARLALRVGAHGLHLSEPMLWHGPKTWRHWRRPDWLVTAAAHSPQALFRAARAGVDAALVSPVFPTASHPGAPPLGAIRLAAMCRLCPMAVYALGGVSAATARRLKNSGAAGVAGIGAFVKKG